MERIIVKVKECEKTDNDLIDVFTRRYLIPNENIDKNIEDDIYERFMKRECKWKVRAK